MISTIEKMVIHYIKIFFLHLLQQNSGRATTSKPFSTYQVPLKVNVAHCLYQSIMTEMALKCQDQ